MKDDKFKSQNLAPPAEFELTDYNSATKNAPIPPDAPPPSGNNPATEKQ